MTADGPAGPVRCVLEEPWHPSYPHVFAQGGEIRKIPVRRLVPGTPPSQGDRLLWGGPDRRVRMTASLTIACPRQPA